MTSERSAQISFFSLIALLATLAAGKAVLFDTLDPDAFWHLKVGETLLQQGIGPITDDLSFSSTKAPWTPYSWLAEIFMVGLWNVGGFRLALVAQALMQAAFLVFIALASNELCQSIHGKTRRWPIFIATLLGGYWALPFLSFRPVTMMLVLLALSGWILARDRREPSKLIWLLIPITMIGVNLHLFAFFIPLVLGLHSMGIFLDQFRSELLNPPKVSTRYAWLFLGTTLGFLCTPMLPGLLTTIFHYSAQDTMVAGPVIAEMQSLLKGNSVNAVIIVAIAFCVYSNANCFRTAELLFLPIGVLMIWKLGRFSPIFALLICPLVAASLPDMSERLLTRPKIAFTIAFLLLLTLGKIVVEFPKSSHGFETWLNRHGPETPGYPTAAANYLATNIPPVSGRLINEFTWGGYLEFRLHDQFRTLLDGRTQVFPNSLWQATYFGTDETRSALIAQSAADAAVIPIGKSLFRTSLESLNWRRTYQDDRAEIWLPPLPTVMTKTE